MAIRDNADFGKSYFLNFNGNGNLCEKSKEAKDGFVAYNNPMTGAFSGYWKEYYNGIVGYLNYIGIRTSSINNVNVSFFVITLKDYKLKENYVVSLPLYTQKGGISPYVKSFVKYYKNIDINREIVLNAFKKKATDAFAPCNLVIAYPGEDGRDTMVELFYKKGLNGWPDAETVMLYGKEKSDYTKQDQFVYDRLIEYINDFNAKIDFTRKSLNEAFRNTDGYQQPVNNVSQQQPAQQAPQQYQQPQQAGTNITGGMTAPTQAPTGFQQRSQMQTQPQQPPQFNSGMNGQPAPQYQEVPSYMNPPEEDYDNLPF